MDKLVFIILTILTVGMIVFEIALFIQYGSKPITEIPAWVLIFLFNKK